VPSSVGPLKNSSSRSKLSLSRSDI